MRRKRFWTMALVLALVLALWPPMAHPTEAATYTVNTVVDENDGSCNDGDCSLRDAIILANNNPGPDTINFNISGCGGVCTIQPTSALPTLNDGTTIDGYTQPGAAAATDGTPAMLLIEINGASAGYNVGFHISSAGNVIKGLVINRFEVYGVFIWGSGATGNTVSGNYIGTDANGTTALGNTSGVYIGGGAQNNTVGGDTPGERNVISGNDYYGVAICWHNGTTGNTVSGNYIGTDANGTTDLGNTSDGVCIGGGAQNNTVGGDTSGERNVISGNNAYGVRIQDSSTMSNTVSGNYIGTDANGTADLGNIYDGVLIGWGAQNNTVGGDTPGERNVISGNDGGGVSIWYSGTTGNIASGNYIGTDINGTTVLSNTRGVAIGGGAQNNTVGPGNVIAHSSQNGVTVDGSSTTSNTITQNSIFSNTMGIDLMNGANGDIAAPVIVTTTAGSVNVVGTACPGCTVEVFRNSDTDSEGETYIGNTTATASGNFTVTVSSLTQPYLTATATDAISGTSEFSAVFTSTLTGGAPLYLPIILKSY